MLDKMVRICKGITVFEGGGWRRNIFVEFI
jgi:hypothetical protein